MANHNTSLFPPTWTPGQPINQVVQFFDDFITGGTGTTIAHKFATTADAAEWLKTVDNSGTTLIADTEDGGWLTVNPGTSAADFVSLQLNGEAFATRANRITIFEARLKISDVDDVDFLIGLAQTDITGTTKGPLLDGTNHGIYFRKADSTSSSLFYCVTEDDTTETTTQVTTSVATLADDTAFILQFIVYGTTKVVFYVNGKIAATHTTNIPDAGDGMTVSLEHSSPTGTTATTISYDYVAVQSDRSRT